MAEIEQQLESLYAEASYLHLLHLGHRVTRRQFMVFWNQSDIFNTSWYVWLNYYYVGEKEIQEYIQNG
jgi:hypothetical protein